jgi:glycosyltransferase involved in cell wall biosynthesis
VRLAVWSPRPPSASGIADYVAESLPHLARGADVELVTGETADSGADLDVYHVGNSAAHAYAYRAALRRPGVVVLHDWSLHHLVLGETVEKGDVASYLREMRRAHGEAGTFVGRQVARGLGGDLLPALFPLNDRILEGSLAVVALTGAIAARAARRLPGRPVLHLPHHLSLPLDPLPSRAEARRALGLPEDALLLTAPGLATGAKRLDVAIRAVAAARRSHPKLRLVVAGEVAPGLPLDAWARAAGLGDALLVTGRLGLADFTRHLCAADVVLALRFPSYGEMSGALVRALGVGRAALVTAGSPFALEFPDGVVVPVDPGPHEEAELVALLQALLAAPDLREGVARAAREHVRRHHDLRATVERLLAFLGQVLEGKDRALAALAAERASEGSLLAYALEEVRWAARDLGLAGSPPGLGAALQDLLPAGP